jgi:predicted membrane protein (TIGR00267 family)
VKLLDTGRSLLDITRAQGIVRRYFVVNGFDGALTMLGLIIGFTIGGPAELSVIINACLGAAIALGVSGVSSAYISETAERQRALEHLEDAMLTNLEDSSHGAAARWVPLLIALTNGAAPLILSLLIIAPLWLVQAGVPLPVAPLNAAVFTALLIVFLLGVYLGRVAGVSWFKSGFRTLLVALVTAVLIYLFVDG